MQHPSATTPNYLDPIDLRSVDELIEREVPAFCAAAGITPKTFARKTLGNTNDLPRLRRMADRLTRKIDRLRGAMWDGREPPERVTILLWLPSPTSTNNLYRRRRAGMSKSQTYLAWVDAAGKEIIAQRPHLPHKSLPAGAFTAHLLVSRDDPGDIDNRLKSLLDLLHRMQVTPDDRHLWDARVTRSAAIKPGRCNVLLSSVPS